MLERGYRATTIADIARRAGVHVDTVYALVGRKPVLLRELIEHAISGTDEAIPAERRDYVSAIRSEPDPRRKLAIYARATREIHARLAPLLLALRDASTTEPEARAVWDEISKRRAMNMRELAKELKSVGGIRPGSPSPRPQTASGSPTAPTCTCCSPPNGAGRHTATNDGWSTRGRASFYQTTDRTRVEVARLIISIGRWRLVFGSGRSSCHPSQLR